MIANAVTANMAAVRVWAVGNSGAAGGGEGDVVAVGVGEFVDAGEASIYSVCRTSAAVFTAKFKDSPHLPLNVVLLQL